MAAASGTFTEEFSKVIADTIKNAEGSWGNYQAGLCLNLLSQNDAMADVQELTNAIGYSLGYARVNLTGTWTFASAEASYATFAGWTNSSGTTWEAAQCMFVSVTVGGTERLAWFLDLGGVTLSNGDNIAFPSGLDFELDSA